MQNINGIEVPGFITDLGEKAVETYVGAKKIFDDLKRKMGTSYYIPRDFPERRIFREVEINGEKCILPLYMVKAFQQ